MSTWRFAKASWSANLRSALEYRASFLLQSAFMILNNFSFLGFWALFFTRFEGVGGWKLADVALLYAVSATGFGLAMVLAGGSFALSANITSGQLDSWLLRGQPVLLQAWLARLRVSGFGDIATGILLVGLTGELTPGRIAAWVVASLGSAGALLAFWTLVNSLAFFAGDSSELSRQASNAVITFSLYPPGLFTGTVRIILYVLVPAGLVGWLPTQLVLDWSWTGGLALAGGLAALGTVTFLAWHVGLSRYESGNLTQSVLD